MTEHLDELLRDALRGEVSDVEAPEDGARELHRRLQHQRRRRRVTRLAATAATVAVVAVASVMLSRGGDDNSPVIADEPPTTTGEPTTTAGVTSTTEPAVVAPAVDPRDAMGPRPDQIVATTEDGRLVVLEAPTGNEVRELARAGTGSEYENAGSESFIDAVEVSPDGSTVYYSTCCEPAPGAMYRVPLDGSEAPVRLALDGAYPDIHPAFGDQIVITNSIGVYAYDLPVGTLDSPTGSTAREIAEAQGNAAQPFWLGPTALAFQRLDPSEGSSIAVVSGIDTDSRAVTDLPTDDGVGWEYPVGTEAAIIVAEQCCAPDYADTATGRFVDPSSGEVLDSFELRTAVADLDLNGSWLLITYTDGELGVLDLGDETLSSEPLATGVTKAAWVPPATVGSTDFSDCPGRPNGSSPSTFDPTAGTYAAQSVSVEDGNQLRFDIVQWLSGEAANDAYFEQTGDNSGAPNDYFIRNDNVELRTAPVANDAELYVLRADGYADSLHPVALNNVPTDDPDRTFWLTFSDGSITGICQQYRP